MELGTLEVVIASATVVATTWVATRDLALKRQTDSLASFLHVVATVHGRPTDGRQDVDLVEQLAALWIIAELGKRHRWLRPSAREALTRFSKYSTADPHTAAIAGVASKALNTLPT